jgi:Holliday junction resolvase
MIYMPKKSDYSYGKAQEKKVARLLRAKGASVEASTGSRGAADLKVTFPTGTKWNVQVKSSRKGTPATLSAKDSGRLKQGARKSNATPVVANVTQEGVLYVSERSGRKLTPPPRKRR